MTSSGSGNTPTAGRVWAHAEWGPSGLCENALERARWLLGVTDVVGGVAFDRVTGEGRSIHVALPRGEFL